jgi:hypothetical protein
MPTSFCVLILRTTYLTYKGERLLKAAGIPCRLVSKPRYISSDCGLALRVEAVDEPRSLALMAEAGVELLNVCAP